MAQAKPGDHVKIRFTGKLEDGTVFATTTDAGPIEFTLGKHEVFPDLEQAIEGMQPGETKTIEVASDRAYGPRQDELQHEVPRADLPPDLDPQVGQQLRVDRPGMQPVIVAIAAVTDETVTIDTNHPLAGKDLTFDLELVEVG